MGKKAILVSNRKSVNKETNAEVRWLTMFELPREFTTKEGKKDLWYPKKEDALLNYCVDSVKQPDDFIRLSFVPEGAICIVNFGVNEYTNKTFIASVDIVKDTDKYTPDMLYRM